MAGSYIKARTPRDIEALVVWALVDNGLGGQFDLRDDGRIGWRELGTIVDGGSARWSVALPRVQHDDALAVAEALLALTRPEAAAVVIRHGRTACRPDWCEEGVGHAAVKTNRRGQVEWHYERPGDTKSRKIEPKRVWVGETPERFAWYRAQYGLWWAALQALVVPLNAVLVRYEATGPGAPQEPWNGAPVRDAAGNDMRGMLHRSSSLARRADIAAVGPIELPRTVEDADVAVGESAARQAPCRGA